MALLLTALSALHYWGGGSSWGYAPPPAVNITNGTVIGSREGGIESWKGIPFAQDPVGQLRLRPPQTINVTFNTLQATGTPTGCPPLNSRIQGESGFVGGLINFFNTSPLFNSASKFGEACLNLNVQRPEGTNSTSKLPVVIWFFGGGFESGTTQPYEGTNIITKSVSMGHPIIFVATNYRNGAFGFLHGKEMVADGSTNLGLRDQRMAMQWVAENIEAFGGDPDKVTLWGESAGSISVMDHQIINGGDINYRGKPLFRAGIMDSGSITPVVPSTSAKAQFVYDTVVREAGCAEQPDTVACLRSVSFEKFSYGANSLPGIFSYRSVDLAYIPRGDPTNSFFPISPEKLIENGTYARVPVIIGDQEDEGTLFALTQTNVTTPKLLNDYFVSFFANATYDIVAAATATYPDEPAAGSPFRTGEQYNIYPQYKRLAAIIGDSVFTLKRRIYLEYTSSVQPCWSYLGTFLHGSGQLGTFHGSDVYETFIGTPDNLPGNSMLAYYVSFINSLDPNALNNGTYTFWPKWTNDEPILLNMSIYENNLIRDDFRKASSDYLKAHLSNFQT